MKRLLLLSLCLVVLTGGLAANNPEIQNYTNYVDPFIGTGGHGHTYPGAALPFGLVQLSPDTRLTGWDGASGYHYTDSVVYGFSHRHLSGTGISDYCDILFMPATGEVKYNNGAETSHKQGYASLFSHDNEEASPGYYSVHLDDYDVDVELTATERTGMHRYTFPGNKGHIIIDLEHRDKVQDAHIEIVDERTIRGYRISKSWADSQHVYFYARFSQPFTKTEIQSDGKATQKEEVRGKALKAALYFDTSENKEILAKVGISAVDAKGAKKNLQKENPGWDFENIRQKAKSTWEKELGKIEVEGGTAAQKTKFYTALYHAFLSPDIYNDVDGRYRGHDDKIHKTDKGGYYTVFSLWDTFRATHPLFTLTQQERTNEFIRTFLKIYEQGKELPVWELSAHESYVMIGYHAIPVIADAYVKGIRDYDAEKALKAMKYSAGKDHFGLKGYRSNGYISAGKESESVSRTLEYAYDDWCIAEMARLMDDREGYESFIRRAQYYKNVFDPQTRFMRARINGGWYTPFKPQEVNFNYTEANAWQYRFFVPQDVSGLSTIMGGNKALEAALDSMFSEAPKTSGHDIPDITGRIGQYAHGNEPSHHMAYLYNYIGKPGKTQQYVREIMDRLYTTQPDGLSGNEDCGQMSSWLVLSAMGFYPVTPGMDYYTIGTPLFPKVTLNLENGNQFVIEAENLSEQNFHVGSVKLNGETWNKSYLPHDKIVKGGTMSFSMSDKPGKAFGKGADNLPPSAITDAPVTATPYVKNGTRVFDDKVRVALGNLQDDAITRYEAGGGDVTPESAKYAEPLTFEETTTISFRSFHEEYGASSQVDATFRKLPANRSIKLLTDYSGQYEAGGKTALIDKIRGSNNYRTGDWQGYYNNDLKAIVDLGQVQHVDSVGLSCLQNTGSWIFMPQWVEISVARKKDDFTSLGKMKNFIPYKMDKPLTATFKKECDRKVRYIKVHAKIIDEIPEWHVGAGKPGWIFADEIIIEQ